MISDPPGAALSERTYHHGNLREVLIEAGVELARAGGPTAVQLRAATRQAGVSHNAAYRHFANQEDLVAAVAERCMARLAQLMLRRAGEVRVRGATRRAEARLGAIGRAYIEFARTEPGWFRTAFSSARPHGGLPASRGTAAEDEQQTSPLAVLGARLDELAELGALTPEHREGAEFAAWSAVHGLSSLLVDGPLRDLPEAQVQVAIDVVLEAVGRALQ